MWRLRRWWRGLWRGGRPATGDAGPVVAAFLDGASVRECAYRFWHRGASAELATAHDWPEAVRLVEVTIRDYCDALAEQLAEVEGSR